MWKPAPCLLVLRDQIDRAWPGRDRASDGLVGDATHSGQGAPLFNSRGYGTKGSDHNVDLDGYVCALDIDDNLGPITSKELGLALAASGDQRISYLISYGRIWSSRGGTEPFSWRPYTSADPHTGHIHISVRHTPQYRDDTTPWDIGIAPPVTVPHIGDDDMLILTADGKSWLLCGGKARPIANGTDYTALKLAGIGEAKVSRATVDEWT